MQIFLSILLCYLLYRFIVGFVLPIASTASRVRKQFREMQNQQSAFTSSASTVPEQNIPPTDTPLHKQRSTSGKNGSKEDYIDFEEVPVAKP